MTDASVATSAADVFRKWKEFLDGGTLPAADAVALAHPQVTGPLHKLIDEYLAGRATDAIGPDVEPDGPAGYPVIPGYTILGSLGRGGMGEVYRVRDALDREWALKLARRKHLSVTGLRRFLAEAKAMARLDHPNVAEVHDYKENEGRPFFLMPLFPANLADRWADYCVSLEAAVRLMLAVAEGVGHLHSRGFIHRDLKPSNILIAADGRPVISDFGLIKGLADADSSASDSGADGSAETQATGAKRAQTMAGLVLGTRRYMAPEQAAGLNHLAGPGWDVWALGVMLHELLAGQPPRSSTAPERLLGPAEPDNPPLTTIKPTVDPRLARVVHKCLARDPAGRYPDALAVAADLAAVLRPPRKRTVQFVVAGLIVALLATTATAALLRKPGPAPKSWQEADRDDLAAGRELDLDLEARVRDGRFVLYAGEAQVKPTYDPTDGVLGLATTDAAMLVLVPRPGIDRYRFEAEVCHTVANPASHLGLIQGLTAVESTDGPRLLFETLAVNEHAGPAGPHQYWLGLVSPRLPGAPPAPPGMNISTFAIWPEVINPPKGPVERWTRLAVDVRPGSNVWHHPHVGPRTVDRLPPGVQNWVREVVHPVNAQDVVVPADGGLGIYVYNSSCRVRNVRVIPRPPGAD